MFDRHANPADGAACLCISGAFLLLFCFLLCFFFLTAAVIDSSVKRENIIPILKYTQKGFFF